MKVLYCGYRPWAKEVFDYVAKAFPQIEFGLITNKEVFNDADHHQFDFLLFMGWSWIVPKEIVNKNVCVCLHPSPLPKYRGGSPIQHQIINGETMSAVSLFVMNEKIDAGPVIVKYPFSLSGDLNDVIKNMTLAAKASMFQFLKTYIRYGKFMFEGTQFLLPQDESQKTYFKRRTPGMSEITVEEIQNSTTLQLHNKIRALQDPYPNAFIHCKDGKKLYITNSKLED